MPPAPPLPLDVRIRNRVLSWLRDSGMSQAELARRIGKDQPWMSRYLAGTLDADLSTIERLAGAFGNSLATLLDVVPDARRQRVNDMFDALTPDQQTTIERLLIALTQAHRPRRGAK